MYIDEHQSVLAAPRNPINTAVTPAMLNNNTATPAVNGNVAKPPRNTSYKYVRQYIGAIVRI